MLLKIVNVDMDGYTGRDFHPKKSDEGLIVSVVGLETYVVDGEGTSIEPVFEERTARHGKLSPEGAIAAHDEIVGHDGGLNIVRCWTCVTENGRTLELMDHEVELHQAGR